MCSVCGYVYDLPEGDAKGGIEPGTDFENPPYDWICPVCGAEKDQFDKETKEIVMNQEVKIYTTPT